MKSVCVYVCVCDAAVDGVQQCVKLSDPVRGGDIVVAELTIAFTGTSFDMDKFPDRTTHNGVTNGNLH